MRKIVVKISSEQEALFILSLAFEHGFKWWDDDNAVKPSGQKLKNEKARYLYFGYKGDGLVSWFGKVKKDIPPADVFNGRSQLKEIIGLFEENDALHVGADELEFSDESVRCGCKSYSDEQIEEILNISKQVSSLSEAIIFHANGDVTAHGRRISGYLLQRIADEIL